MAITFTIPDYSELEEDIHGVQEKLKEFEERLDRQNEINNIIKDECKGLQYQNDVCRKGLNKIGALVNDLSFKVNQLETPNDEEDGVETEENEGDEPTNASELMEKMNEFIEAMETLKQVLKKIS